MAEVVTQIWDSQSILAELLHETGGTFCHLGSTSAGTLSCNPAQKTTCLNQAWNAYAHLQFSPYQRPWLWLGGLSLCSFQHKPNQHVFWSNTFSLITVNVVRFIPLSTNSNPLPPHSHSGWSWVGRPFPMDVSNFFSQDERHKGCNWAGDDSVFIVFQVLYNLE